MSALKTDGVRTEPVRTAGPASTYETKEPSYKGAGWILFAALMFVIAASLNVIWGIAAVSSSHFFVANAHYIISDLNTWGWVAIGFGAVEALAALSIWRGGAFGRWFGIVVGGFAALVAMMSIPAYPFWSLALVALYVLVIYGLAVYGGTPAMAD
ncbi:MAG TPA: hypothetical protein VMA77_15570 [Solirubrobacteraceae bacterium]|nr:hypothetical protein [Solirubrobacteraceae bacterium]